MTELSPTLDEWRRLYQAVIRVKEIAPWEWMTETDVFGVQNPETDEIGFVSVMGTLGEHLSLALYLGPEGLYSFWGFQQIADSAPPEAVLGMPHFQASFEDRNTLSKKDRDISRSWGSSFVDGRLGRCFAVIAPASFPGIWRRRRLDSWHTL